MPDEVGVDEVVEMAVQEMHERMKDPVRRAEIPDHVLIRFMSEANEMEKRKEVARKRDEEIQRDTSVLEVVRNSSLPSDRKRRLLKNEISRLAVLHEQLLNELEALSE